VNSDRLSIPHESDPPPGRGLAGAWSRRGRRRV